MFGLEFIKQLRPCKWRYLPPLDDGVEHLGFIAQEVEALIPHTEYGVVVMEEGLYKLRLTELIGPLVKAIQELEERVKKLEGGSHG
jgi:hypothetical protein